MKNATTTDLSTIFDQPATEPATWAPTPGEFIALANEATTAVRLREAGKPLTPEQVSLLEWISLPLPMLTRPAHLEG